MRGQPSVSEEGAPLSHAQDAYHSVLHVPRTPTDSHLNGCEPFNLLIYLYRHSPAYAITVAEKCGADLQQLKRGLRSLMLKASAQQPAPPNIYPSKNLVFHAHHQHTNSRAVCSITFAQRFSYYLLLKLSPI